jgi:hypothetical protein
MICTFVDEFGTKKDIANIVFTNYDVEKSNLNTYKHHDSGEIVTKVTFKDPAICAILGHNNIGLTLDCKDKGKGKDDGDERNRRGGGWS